MAIRLRNGVYHLRTRTVGGRRLECSLHTANEKEAIRTAAKLEAEFYADTNWGGKPGTWEQWTELFTATCMDRYKNKKGFLRVFKHAHNWRAWKLNQITPQECEKYVARRLAEGAPLSTVALERRLLRVVFNKAVEQGKLAKSPWSTGTTGFKVLPRMRVLTLEEEGRLLSACRATTRAVVQFLLLTGLRSDELLNATPQSLIHLPRKGIRVIGKGLKVRVVPLSPTAWELAHRILPLDIQYRTLSLNFERAAIKAGLTEASRSRSKKTKANITLHDLRRTFATRLAEKQYPIDRLSKLLGHASTATTATFYTHLTPVTEADLLMEALGENWGTTGAETKKA